MAPITKTTPKHCKTVDTIQPVTPLQAHEPSSLSPSSSASLPPRRRSLRLASMSNSDLPQCDHGNDSLATPVRVSGDPDADSTGSGNRNDAVSDTVKGSGNWNDAVSDTVNGSGNRNDAVSDTVNGSGNRNDAVSDTVKGSENRNDAVSGTVKGSGTRKVKGKLVTVTVMADDRGKGFLNLRSGKKVRKRGMEVEQDSAVNSGECGADSGNGGAKRSKKTAKKKQDEGKGTVNAVGKGNESAERSRKTRTRKQEGRVTDSAVDEVELEMHNVVEDLKSVDSDKKGKRKLGSSGSSENDIATGNVEVGSASASASASSKPRLSREEKGKTVVVNGDSHRHGVVAPEIQLGDSDPNDSLYNTVLLLDREQPRNANNNQRGNGSRMGHFKDIARENASRFAHFAAEEEENNDVLPEAEPEVERQIEDWPGPFSTAMKIIRDRGVKNVPTGCTSSDTTLMESIKWVPRRNQGQINRRFSVPSLQEHCLKILVKNVDAIVSLDSVPDALRHRLSQLLCDSRKMDGHFFELLVSGSPTEIRLRDCSWLSEEQFTKAFQMCDPANVTVLQLDQCGRCLPDYVILATLAQSQGHLPRLTSLSVSGACRLSDVGLQALVTSAPALRSINLCQCSLLTSKSVFILAESLKSLLKELYLDECQGIDAATVVPALVELEHLEVLSLAGIHTVCDEFVKDYIIARGHNLKELVLKDCINLTDRSMKLIAEHCPGLCVLDIMNLNKLTDLSIGYLTNGCRALHTLKLCRNPFSDEAIAAFVETTGESLKELSLNNIKKVGYHTTLSLANHAKNLHTLDLSWCRNLTDNSLGLIVDSCSTLRLLKLFGCTQVTDVFLNGHSNLQIQIIGLKMSPVLQLVKVPDPHQGALNYSSVSVDLV